MSSLYVSLMILSFAGLLTLIFRAYWQNKNRRALLVRLVIWSLAGVVLVRLFGTSYQAKGAEEPLFALVLYLCMVVGMLASYAYHRLEGDPSKRAPLDWGTMLAPVFTSPIVFLPLLAALQNADIDLQSLDTPRLMVFLVAFENGFFWKEYFDKRQQKGADANA